MFHHLGKQHIMVLTFLCGLICSLFWIIILFETTSNHKSIIGGNLHKAVMCVVKTIIISNVFSQEIKLDIDMILIIDHMGEIPPLHLIYPS